MASVKLTKLFKDFFNSEKTSGVLLICCTCISLILSNSSLGEHYISFWEKENLAGHSLTHWINDGFMAIFFLLIGLELEREVYAGELSQFKNALFPICSALGGVLIPALIYFSINNGTATASGAGIPMATDIAFAIGILSILGNKVPAPLKIFLTALAVIDDLCAIIVIALFYTESISFLYLSVSLGIFVVLLVLNRLKIRNLIPYLIGGAGMWYFMLHSGVHATLSGVLLAFAIPFGNGDEKSTSYILQHFLHKPVAFIIVPLFALANTCIVFTTGWHEGLSSNESIGILTGLVIGKPIGIVLFGAIAVYAGISTIPSGLKWKHIFGAGILGGIGFTMSIFITMLAFNDPHFISIGKISIIFASLISAVVGIIVLSMMLKRNEK
ncbi:MAG: Na+/H+ antiporter NhaA [Ferruginibacter sp.]|nr:Na+/H+ antiporter NhaA [Ferruginibacter sp.]